MKIITAVEDYQLLDTDICVFLAGGITNCADWQKQVIELLSNKQNTSNLVIFNPRRANFPIHDTNASLEQIEWEFKWLERMDIFSMYFSNGVSDQPICMYELGRNLMRMQMRFPENYMDRIVISCETEYKRKTDVIIQSRLALGKDIVLSNESDVEFCGLNHADAIYDAYNKLLEVK